MTGITRRALRRVLLLLYWRPFCEFGADMGMSDSCAEVAAALREPCSEAEAQDLLERVTNLLAVAGI